MVLTGQELWQWKIRTPREGSVVTTRIAGTAKSVDRGSSAGKAAGLTIGGSRSSAKANVGAD
jgi:hypothetical protein